MIYLPPYVQSMHLSLHRMTILCEIALAELTIQPDLKALGNTIVILSGFSINWRYSVI
jgi:hypothetical protein